MHVKRDKMKCKHNMMCCDKLIWTIAEKNINHAFVLTCNDVISHIGNCIQTKNGTSHYCVINICVARRPLSVALQAILNVNEWQLINNIIKLYGIM